MALLDGFAHGDEPLGKEACRSIGEDLPERDVSMHLHAVEQAAREVMSRMVLTPPDRHPHQR